MMYDTVVKKMASRVPLGIATAGFWVKGWKVYGKVFNVYFFLSKYFLSILNERFLQIPFKQAYFQISGDVCSSQDSRCRGKENREHAKEAALWSTPVRDKISGKNISCCKQKKEINTFSQSLLYVSVYCTWSIAVCTFVAKEPLGLFLWCSRNYGSDDVTCKWYHDDQKEQNLGL